MPEGRALTQGDLEKIDTALAEIVVAQEEVMLAKRADIDTGDAGVQLAANAAKLRRIRQVYFPNE